MSSPQKGEVAAAAGAGGDGDDPSSSDGEDGGRRSPQPAFNWKGKSYGRKRMNRIESDDEEDSDVDDVDKLRAEPYVLFD